jgi:hypothetical protein
VLRCIMPSICNGLNGTKIGSLVNSFVGRWHIGLLNKFLRLWSYSVHGYVFSNNSLDNSSGTLSCNITSPARFSHLE